MTSNGTNFATFSLKQFVVVVVVVVYVCLCHVLLFREKNIYKDRA